MLLPARQVSDPGAQLNFEALELLLFQPGDLKPTMATAAPKGWLLADGTTYNSSAYPDLAKAMGVTASTFTVPDMRGRVPVGAGTGSGLTARTLAATGGAETVTLSAAESGVNSNAVVSTNGSHSHGGATGGAGGHTHGLPGTLGFLGGSFGGSTAGSSGTAALASATDNPGNHTHSISADGSHNHTLTARAADSAHNNMQPFYVVNWLIRT